MKFDVSWIAIGISLGSLVVSGLGYFHARKVQKTTEHQFKLTNRPYLHINTAHIKNSDRYIVLSHEDDRTVKIDIRFELSNEGKLPAYDIKYPENTQVSKAQKRLDNFKVEISSDTICIPPGKSSFMHLNMAYPASAEQYKEVYENVTKNREGFPFHIIISYRGPDDEEKKYKSELKGTVYLRESTIEKSHII